MELPSKILQQIAFNTRPKIEEQMLIVMDKSTHEEHLPQPLQTNIKHFKIGVTFLTGCNGIFNVTDKTIEAFYPESITDKDGVIQTSIPQGAYELESLNDVIKRNIIDVGCFTEADYPFTIKRIYSTLVFVIEISTQEPSISFFPR